MLWRVSAVVMVGWLVTGCASSTRVDAQIEESAIRTPPFGAHNRWPIYRFTQYLYVEETDIHVLGSSSVSEWMMRESANLVTHMVAALKRGEDRAKFKGHRAYLITDDDPSIPGARQGHRNTGGDGFSLFNEVMACAKSVDTLYPDGRLVERQWGTPVHEFGHAIEHTLGLESRSDAIYSTHARNYNPRQAREYFAWSVQRWFDSARPPRTRDNMPQWEYDYLADIFDAQNTWKPQCTREYKVFPPLANDAPPTVEQNRPDPVAIEPADLEQLLGNYAVDRPRNDWHIGSITVESRDEDGHPNVLRWTNQAGASWLLYPDASTGTLRTDEHHPYYKPGKVIHVYVAVDQTNPNAPRLGGLWMGSGLYRKLD